MKIIHKIPALMMALAVCIFATGCGASRRVAKDKVATPATEDVIFEDYEAPMEAKPMEAAPAPIVTSSLESGDFFIEVERIMPRKYPAKETMDGYTVSLKDNILKCYLPYIGEVRYSFSNDDAIAISTNKTAVTPKVTMNPSYKKCYALIEFTFKSKYNNEAFYFKIELYKNGNAYITVNSQYRDPITYYGKLEEYPEKNN